MSEAAGSGAKGTKTVYSGMQYCISTQTKLGKTVASDCPYTGKGEEFSPGNLLEASVAGCMLLSMGALAARDGIDISGTCIDVKVTMGGESVMRITGIDVAVTMPQDFAQRERIKLERAADACPIKHSFAADIPVSVRYEYPE